MPNPIETFRTLARLQELIDFSRLPQVVAAIGYAFDSEPPLEAPGAIEARIREFIHLAETIVLATKTPTDNGVVDALAKIASNEQLLALSAQFIRWLLNQRAGEPERLPLIDPAFAAAGIDFDTLTRVLDVLRTLWEMYSAWRGAKGA